MLHKINDDQFQSEVLDYSGPVLLVFSAPWCNPCRILEPVLEEFSQEHTFIKCVKVNVDDNPKSATRYTVQSVPTLIILNHGEQVGMRIGGLDKSSMLNWIRGVLPS